MNNPNKVRRVAAVGTLVAAGALGIVGVASTAKGRVVCEGESTTSGETAWDAANRLAPNQEIRPISDAIVRANRGRPAGALVVPEVCEVKNDWQAANPMADLEWDRDK